VGRAGRESGRARGKEGGRERRGVRACVRVSRVRAMKLTSRGPRDLTCGWHGGRTEGGRRGKPIHNPSKDRLKAVSDGALLVLVPKDDGRFFCTFLRPAAPCCRRGVANKRKETKEKKGGMRRKKDFRTNIARGKTVEWRDGGTRAC